MIIQTMQSETIGKLGLALSKAQAQMEGAKKDKENPFFKSKYSDLYSVWQACRQPLSQNELAVIQTTDNSEGKLVIITTLVHSSGEWIRGGLEITPVKNDPQSIGSAITYGRRYTLAAVVGVSPEDDDAEGAMGRSEKKGNAEGGKKGKDDEPKKKTFDETIGEFSKKLPSKTFNDILTEFRCKYLSKQVFYDSILNGTMSANELSREIQEAIYRKMVEATKAPAETQEDPEYIAKMLLYKTALGEERMAYELGQIGMETPEDATTEEAQKKTLEHFKGVMETINE